MEWNIAAECISLVILGIVWSYSRRGSHLPTPRNKIFQICLMTTFFAVFTNVLATIMIHYYLEVPIWATWMVNMIYFMLTPLMGLTYFFYTLTVIYTESEVLKKVMAISALPGMVYIGLVLMNPFTKDIFDININQGYVRGRWIAVTYLIFYAYCVGCVVIAIVNRKRIPRSVYRILTSFPLLAVVVIIVQQFSPEVILSGSAATCAFLIIYLHLENKQISMDHLTDVPNRQELLNMLELILRKKKEQKCVLLVVSLRDFRQLNNTCGHQNGDRFLKSICEFLCEIGPAGNVYRFSGDEFALLFTKENREQIKACVSRIQARMARPWEVNDYHFTISSAMGIIYHYDKTESLEQIINAIEYAVAQAKSGKYGQVCYCNKEMLEKLERRRKIIQILKKCLEEESFEMYYQPIYSVKTGEFYYAESLMRIPNSEIGPIYPSEFIPIAEETGLLIEITYVILDKVCKFINKLREKRGLVGAIHVNFSAIQFSQLDLAERVLRIVNKNDTPMSALEIEFTESTLAESAESVIDFMMKMKSCGIGMGLDDFGTGYSNIATVINIPFGTVKLDRSLIEAAISNEKSALAVRNLTKTFKELGMRVIAEGVETEEQGKLVKDFGVDQIQGYYYAKPMPEAEAEAFMCGT